MTRRHHHRPASPTRPTHERSVSAILTVYVGQRCLGWTMHRSSTGWQAYDAEQRSLGSFESQRAAIDAIKDGK